MFTPFFKPMFLPVVTPMFTDKFTHRFPHLFSHVRRRRAHSSCVVALMPKLLPLLMMVGQVTRIFLKSNPCLQFSIKRQITQSSKNVQSRTQFGVWRLSNKWCIRFFKAHLFYISRLNSCVRLEEGFKTKIKSNWNFPIGVGGLVGGQVTREIIFQFKNK